MQLFYKSKKLCKVFVVSAIGLFTKLTVITNNLIINNCNTKINIFSMKES